MQKYLINKTEMLNAVEEAPSNLSIVGAGGEIQLTDAIAALMNEQIIHAYEFDGIRYDCGSKLGRMKASAGYALRHPELNG